MFLHPRLFASVVGHVGAELARRGFSTPCALEEHVRAGIANTPGLAEGERAAAFAMIWARLPKAPAPGQEAAGQWELAEDLAAKYGFAGVRQLFFHLRQRMEATSGRLLPEPMESLSRLLGGGENVIQAGEANALTALP